jgi:hypothetical protein
MSLINSSYFIGPLTIAQLGQPAVENNLNLFINRAEPQLLEAALGYDLWQDFMMGLQQTVIDPKWLALRDGITFKSVSSWPSWYYGFSWFNRYWYLNSQRNMRWPGFAAPLSFPAPSQGLSQIVLIAGNASGNPTANVPNPIPGTNTYTWSGLANAIYSIERKPSGTMVENIDYALSNNSQTITLLQPGDKWGVGEIFILKFVQAVATGGPSNSYVSPITGYVYYLWVRDQVTVNTGSGVVKTKSENADKWNPAPRMVDAWNQMSQDMYKLWQYLEATYINDPTIYPSYDRTKIDYGFFQPINVFNI